MTKKKTASKAKESRPGRGGSPSRPFTLEVHGDGIDVSAKISDAKGIGDLIDGALVRMRSANQGAHVAAGVTATTVAGDEVAMADYVVNQSDAALSDLNDLVAAEMEHRRQRGQTSTPVEGSSPSVEPS